MKKFLIAFSALAVMVSAGSVFADVRAGDPSTYSKSLGGGAATDVVLSVGNQRVTSVSVSSGATAGIIGIYDASDLSAASTGAINANLIVEVGSAANTSATVVFTSPIIVTQGVTVVTNDNTNGFSVSVEATQ